MNTSIRLHKSYSIMKYFAYGSNMSLARLRGRTPSANRLGIYTLREHSLRFHKISHDGSGKCDAFHTKCPDDFVIGAVFQISLDEKPDLDYAEGLGYGYEEKLVSIVDADGNSIEALTYYATKIDPDIKTYTWYLNHVLIGAREVGLPNSYIQTIQAIDCIEDPDAERDVIQRAIHR
ncbi:gamma-glutamylcyclotransferase family protein [Solemya velum gill symbiont]|nr:gamma-glutamylcyclotransferase family protein [Solemya velum gill symbiont]